MGIPEGQTRETALTNFLRPWRARFAVGLPLAIALYQFLCDQFGFPTIPRLWGMTGLPWWAWIIVAQIGFTYALFEYVRRQSEGAPEAWARVGERLSRIEERLDGGAVAAGTLDTSKPKSIKLPKAEKERISDSLVVTLDYLERGFEEYIAPIRAIRSWPGILREDGPEAIKRTAELAMLRVREMPQIFGSALKEQVQDLELVQIHPLLIKSKAIPMEDCLNSIVCVAEVMPPEGINDAPLRLPGNEFAKAFGKFEDELQRVKEQIKVTRRKITQGELD